MLHIPLWDGYCTIRGTKEDLVPYMTKLKLTFISVKHWVIDPDVNRLFNQPCQVLALPAYDVEIVRA